MYVGRGQQWPAPGPGVVEGPVARPAFVPPAPHDSGGPQSNKWLNPPPVDRYMGPTYRRMQQGEFYPSSEAYNRPEGLTPAIPPARPAEIPPGMQIVKGPDGRPTLVPLTMGFDRGRFGFDSRRRRAAAFRRRRQTHAAGGMGPPAPAGCPVRSVVGPDPRSWRRSRRNGVLPQPAPGGASRGAEEGGRAAQEAAGALREAQAEGPAPGEADQPTHSIRPTIPPTRRPADRSRSPAAIAPDAGAADSGCTPTRGSSGCWAGDISGPAALRSPDGRGNPTAARQRVAGSAPTIAALVCW